MPSRTSIDAGYGQSLHDDIKSTALQESGYIVLRVIPSIALRLLWASEALIVCDSLVSSAHNICQIHYERSMNQEIIASLGIWERTSTIQSPSTYNWKSFRGSLFARIGTSAHIHLLRRPGRRDVEVEDVHGQTERHAGVGYLDD